MQTSLFKILMNCLSFHYHLQKQNTAKEFEAVTNFIEKNLNQGKKKNPGRGGKVRLRRVLPYCTCICAI